VTKGGAAPSTFEGCYNPVMGISTKFTHADLGATPCDGKRREILEGK